MECSILASVFFVGVVSGQYVDNTNYIVQSFHVGSVVGPAINFVLDFGQVMQGDNSIPYYDILPIDTVNFTTPISEYLYVFGMPVLVSVPFRVDTSDNEYGVLSMWNGSFSYCYKTYPTSDGSNIQLGSKCKDKYVYGSTQKIETNFSNRETLAVRLSALINSSSKIAIEYDTNFPNQLIVYSDIPDVDNISTITIPVFLAVFLMVWLGWTQNISVVCNPGSNLTETSENQIWKTLSDTYAVVIIDAITLCASVATISVFNGFAMLRGGDAIQIVGLTWATTILYMWVGLIGLCVLYMLSTLLYGYNKIEPDVQYDQMKLYQIVEVILLCGGTGTLVWFVLHDLENIDKFWATIFTCIVIVFICCWYFVRQLMSWILKIPMVKTWINFAPEQSKLSLLMLRWSVEFVILTTLHATLPTSLGGMISTTYRNAIGFLIGFVVCVAGGRDITWCMYGYIKDTAVPRSFKILVCTGCIAVEIFVLVYASVFLVGPIFITSVKLELEQTITVLVSLSIVSQAMAIGAIFSLGTLEAKSSSDKDK